MAQGCHFPMAAWERTLALSAVTWDKPGAAWGALTQSNGPAGVLGHGPGTAPQQEAQLPWGAGHRGCSRAGSPGALCHADAGPADGWQGGCSAAPGPPCRSTVTRQRSHNARGTSRAIRRPRPCRSARLRSRLAAGCRPGPRLSARCPWAQAHPPPRGQQGSRRPPSATLSQDLRGHGCLHLRPPNDGRAQQLHLPLVWRPLCGLPLTLLPALALHLLCPALVLRALPAVPRASQAWKVPMSAASLPNTAECCLLCWLPLPQHK